MTARRPSCVPPPVHSDVAHKAITTELQRLTLGGRGPERLELLTTFDYVAKFLDDLSRLGLVKVDLHLEQWMRTWLGLPP